MKWVVGGELRRHHGSNHRRVYQPSAVRRDPARSQESRPLGHVVGVGADSGRDKGDPGKAITEVSPLAGAAVNEFLSCNLRDNASRGNGVDQGVHVSWKWHDLPIRVSDDGNGVVALHTTHAHINKCNSQYG